MIEREAEFEAYHLFRTGQLGLWPMKTPAQASTCFGVASGFKNSSHVCSSPLRQPSSVRFVLPNSPPAAEPRSSPICPRGGKL